MVWQHLLRSWVQQKAAERLKRAAMDAARDYAQKDKTNDTEPDAEEEAVQEPADMRCDVAIVAQTPAELGGVADRLSGVLGVEGDEINARFGGYQGRRVLLVAGDKCSGTVEDTVAAIVEGHQPRWIIAIGFASGLNERLARGDLFIAQHLLAEAGEPLAIDLKMEEADGPPPIRVGTLLSCEGAHHTQQSKQALAAKFAADAVDRQSAAVAAACRRHKTPFFAVHIMADALADDLPQDIRVMVAQPSTAGKLGAATGAIFRRPSSVKDMWKIREDSLVAADSLGRFVLGMVEQLPKPADDG